jgi:hypothetical protein
MLGGVTAERTPRLQLHTASTAGWRPRVEEMRAAFDAGMQSALDDALLLLRPAATPGVQDAPGSLGARRFSSGRLPPSPRAAELEPYVQER